MLPKTAFRRLALAFATFSVAACNCGIQTRGVHPQIVVTPLKLDFGTLPVGTVSELPVSVSNMGQSSLIISSVTVADMDDISVPAAELFVQDCAALPRASTESLKYGDCARFSVRFTASIVETIHTHIVITSNDPDHPTVEVDVAAAAVNEPFPQIQVCVLDATGALVSTACTNFAATPASIPTLDFGTVEYATPVVRKLRILSTGTSDLLLNNVRMSSPNADLSVVNAHTLPAMIAAGTTVDADVVLTASGSGVVTGKVIVLSNDASHPEIDIPIIASEDAPCLQVTPTSMDFGTLTVGQTKLLTLTVANCGHSAYGLTTLDFVPAASSTVFTLTSGDPSGTLPMAPVTMNPGDTHLLNLTYAPTAPTMPPGDTGQFNILTSYGFKQTVPVVGQALGLPSIQVCVLDATGALNPAACTQLAAAPQVIPTLDFGTVEYQQSTVRSLRILNPGSSSLALSAITLATSSLDLSIADPTLPAALTPATSVDVPLILLPTGTGGVMGTVTIASNDSAHPQVVIPVIAQENPPCIQITPTAMDFGTLTVGNSKMLTLMIANCGKSSYEVTTLSWAPTNATSTAFAMRPGDPSGMLPAIPFTFAPGQTHTLDLTYTPKAPTTGSGDTGLFIITSFKSTQTVPVVGQAVAPVPTCGGADSPVAGISVQLNGVAVGANVLPLSTVTLTGAPSTAPAGRTIASYTWSLLSAPANSTTTIQGAGESVSLLCTLVGIYTAGLVVTDSDGCASAQTSVNINVVPGGGLHVQLTWPQSYGDLDLHYVGPKGTFFDLPLDYGGGASDLLYLFAVKEFNGPGNPAAGTYPYGEKPIDWGFANTTIPDGNPANDPSLDADQLWGQGPENVSHPQPFDATYTVMVHYYCSSAYDEVTNHGSAVSGITLGSDANCGASARNGNDGAPCLDYGATTPSVTIFWNGSQIWQNQQTLTAKQVWTAATVKVTGTGTPVVTPSAAPITRSKYGCPDGN